MSLACCTAVCSSSSIIQSYYTAVATVVPAANSLDLSHRRTCRHSDEVTALYADVALFQGRLRAEGSVATDRRVGYRLPLAKACVRQAAEDSYLANKSVHLPRHPSVENGGIQHFRYVRHL